MVLRKLYFTKETSSFTRYVGVMLFGSKKYFLETEPNQLVARQIQLGARAQASPLRGQQSTPNKFCAWMEARKKKNQMKMTKKREEGEKDEEEKVKLFLLAILDPPLPSGVGCQLKIKERYVGNEKNEVAIMGRLKSTIVT